MNFALGPEFYPISLSRQLLTESMPSSVHREQVIFGRGARAACGSRECKEPCRDCIGTSHRICCGQGLS